MKTLQVYLSDEDHAELRKDSFERSISMSSLLKGAYFQYEFEKPVSKIKKPIGKPYPIVPTAYPSIPTVIGSEPNVVKFNPVPKPR